MILEREKGERQYSPFVVNSNFLLENNNNIGILIYSNQYSSSQILQFPFPVLKEYIQSRYLLLNDVMENLKKITEVKEHEWKQHQVNRKLPPIDILNDIIQILGERYKHKGSDVLKYSIVKAKNFLSCKITKNENENIVQEYREKIRSIIPDLCDAVDDMEYEKMVDTLSDVLYSQAEEKNIPEAENINYFIGKVLSQNGPWLALLKFVVEWARKKGVVIEEKMEIIEIDLLIAAVCYFEKKRQGFEKNEKKHEEKCGLPHLA